MAGSLGMLKVWAEPISSESWGPMRGYHAVEVISQPTLRNSRRESDGKTSELSAACQGQGTRTCVHLHGASGGSHRLHGTLLSPAPGLTFLGDATSPQD